MKFGTYFKSLILTSLMMFTSLSTFASEEKEEGKAFDPVGFAIHHVLDNHEIHVWGEGEDAFVIPLPVIVFGSEGMAMFLSSEFHHDDHGHHVVEKNGMHFVKNHDKIYELNKGEHHLSYDKEGNVENASVPFDMSITKNVATLILVAIILILVFRAVGKHYARNGAVAPKGLASWMEPLILFIRDDIAKNNIKSGYERFMPFLLTVFFFILCGNILGLIPVLTNPNLTGNISVTMTLAMFMLVIQLIYSKSAFWKHIFMPPGVPVALYPILVPIELAGIIIKPVALLIRLFANITAGHIIVISLVSIIFVNQSVGWAGLSVPMTLFISVLEILVAFLQAYIFTMLSALFIGMAVEEGHHH